MRRCCALSLLGLLHAAGIPYEYPRVKLQMICFFSHRDTESEEKEV